MLFFDKVHKTIHICNSLAYIFIIFIITSFIISLNLLVLLKELLYFRMEGYQNDGVTEGYQNDEVVVKCEYVYDQGKESNKQNDGVAKGYQNDEAVMKCEYVYDQDKDSDKQNDNIFSDPYSNESSDKDDGNPSAKSISNDMKTSKTSKKKKRHSQYDEDNYALPDPESDDEVKIRKLESNAKANEKQVLAWRATSFLLIGLLFISAICIAYVAHENITL